MVQFNASKLPPRTDTPVLDLFCVDDAAARTAMTQSQLFSMYDVDLFAGAWRWTADEVATALKVSPADLTSWRIHEADPSEAASERFERIRAIQRGLWTSLAPGDYGSWWRKANSHFGGRTAIEIALETDHGLDQVLGVLKSSHW